MSLQTCPCLPGPLTPCCLVLVLPQLEQAVPLGPVGGVQEGTGVLLPSFVLCGGDGSLSGTLAPVKTSGDAFVILCVGAQGREEPGRERERGRGGGPGACWGSQGCKGKCFPRDLTSAAAATLLSELGQIPSPLWSFLTSVLPKEVKLTSLEHAVLGDRDRSLSRQCWVPRAWLRAHLSKSSLDAL